jgi:ATP-dependent Lon protease
VRNQLHIMAPGEYYPGKLSARLAGTGRIVAPTLMEAGRKPHSAIPKEPQVSEVVGLAVAGAQGVILRFEVQATKDSGRIVPLLQSPPAPARAPPPAWPGSGLS